jgi:hypothetical protein
MAIRLGSNNHIELVHRPGEAELAVKALRLIGVDMSPTPFSFAGTTFYKEVNDNLFVSEVTKEQWAFEQWLQEKVAAEKSDATTRFLNGQRTYPQRFTHFGVGVTTLDEWEAIVARIQEAGANDPQLKGRIGVPVLARPGDENSAYAYTKQPAAKLIYQAFVYTDLFSAGLLTVGQAIDFQHYREYDPSWTPEEELVTEPA